MEIVEDPIMLGIPFMEHILAVENCMTIFPLSMEFQVLS